MAKVLNLATNAPSVSPLVLDGNFITCGASRTLSVEDNHAIVKLNALTGSTAVLPAATGSGMTFLFVVSVLATSVSHVIEAATSGGTMQGVLLHMDNADNNVTAYAAAADTSNTITLDRTNGSVNLGEWIEVTDFAADIWQVEGVVSCTTGATASVFSAA